MEPIVATEHYCSQCGNSLPTGSYPLECPNCLHTLYANPKPVAVMLIQVEKYGLLGVRRAISPLGPALPGGFIEMGADWQSNAVREVQEETGLVVKSEGLKIISAASTPNTRELLLFIQTWPVSLAEVVKSASYDDEVSNLVLIQHEYNYVFDPALGIEPVAISDVVFDLHQRAIQQYLAG